MKCPKCGKENPNDSIFCEACGEQLRKNPPPQQTSRNKKSWILWVLIVILTLSSCFLGYSYYDAFHTSSLWRNRFYTLEQGVYVVMDSDLQVLNIDIRDNNMLYAQVFSLTWDSRLDYFQVKIHNGYGPVYSEYFTIDVPLGTSWLEFGEINITPGKYRSLEIWCGDKCLLSQKNVVIE